jgi:uridine kinase
MLIGNPEIGKVYLLKIGYGDTVLIYIVPTIYVLLLYSAWRIKRLNFELFNASLGLVLLLVVLMTPASLGWFVWIVPLLTFYQMSSDRAGLVLAGIFLSLFIINSFFSVPSYSELLSFLAFKVKVDFLDLVSSLTQTMLLVFGVILALKIRRETVKNNDYFRLSRKPFVIGISGDSGAGKDTRSDAICDLFGAHSVATLSGDDYHLWDRQKPMWQVMTHLNPMANDLESYAKDLISLVDGKSIHAGHYDHETGKLTRPFVTKSNDIIIASGLHALYLPILRECYNLKIYMEIDEGLRKHFKLERDVKQRGHTKERVMQTMARREPDSDKFIRPQAQYADLVLSLQPIHPRLLMDTDKHPMRYKLIARYSHGLDELSLTRALVGVCGLHVELDVREHSSEVELTIEGETQAEDIELASKLICPRIFDFLDMEPGWQDGVTGLMQLLVLSHINQSLNKRII